MAFSSSCSYCLTAQKRAECFKPCSLCGYTSSAPAESEVGECVSIRERKEDVKLCALVSSKSREQAGSSAGRFRVVVVREVCCSSSSCSVVFENDLAP